MTGIDIQLTDDTALNEINRIIMNKEKPVFDTLAKTYHLSDYRKNILLWYPFANTGAVLELGSQTGILTEFLQTKFENVYCVEDNQKYNEINLHRTGIQADCKNADEFVSQSNYSVDCIVMNGYLDRCDNAEQVLKKAWSLLNPDGEIIIMSNNPFGMRYFAGENEFYSQKLCGSLDGTGRDTLTKKEWTIMFEKIGIKKYQFYYPFPDYIFPEKIYSDAFLPHAGELRNEQTLYGNRYAFFNEQKAYSTVVEHEAFEEFSNSYLMVLNHKKNVTFVKYAREREADKQIYTLVYNDSENKVEKCAVHSCGEKHLQEMDEFYRRFSNNNKEKKRAYCPVKYEDGKLIFDFIKGQTLEQIIAKNKTIEEILEVLQIVDSYIKVAPLCEKDITTEFKQVFGIHQYEQLTEEEFVQWSNIDLILENILYDSTKCTVIDYEWVFNFPIPRKFIIYRTIFHSAVLASKYGNYLEEIYNKYGITRELRELFLEMEYSFQSYVSKESKLMNIQAYLGNHQINPFDMLHYKIVAIEEHEIIQKKVIEEDAQLDCEFQIKPEETKYVIYPLDRQCVISNLKILGSKKWNEWKEISFKNNNCAFQKENTEMFYLGVPRVEIENKGYSRLRITCQFDLYGCDIVDKIILQEGEIRNRDEIIAELTKKLNEPLSTKIKKKIKKIIWKA